MSNKQMTNLIEKYITAHSLAWAPTTLTSERARLNAVANLIASGPRALYDARHECMKPYALKTLFIRLSDFETHTGRNWGYRRFMKENARLFKHAYTKEAFNVSRDQITTLLLSIESQPVRELAVAVLRNGLRYAELCSFDKTRGLVVGKGGKVRNLLAPELLPDQHPSKRQLGELRRELGRIGIKPHMLRKAAATLLARGGMRSEDLLRVMGWSSLQTAASYLQPQQDAELARFASRVLGGE
jgi:integrase